MKNKFPYLLEIYADTECSLKNIDYQVTEQAKLCQWHVPNSIAAKLVCMMIDLLNHLKFLLEKNVLKNFLNGILKFIMVAHK